MAKILVIDDKEDILNLVKVILEMEEHLHAATYKTEWKYLQQAKVSTLSSVESKVPWLFMGAYFLVYVATLIKG